MLCGIWVSLGWRYGCGGDAHFGRFGDGFAEYFDLDVADGGVEGHRHGW